MFVNIVKLLQLLSKDKCYWRVSCTPVAAAETKTIHDRDTRNKDESPL